MAGQLRLIVCIFCFVAVALGTEETKAVCLWYTKLMIRGSE
jgi:hypothetical protein